MIFTVIQHLVRANWSIVVRRLAENAMFTLPFIALALVLYRRPWQRTLLALLLLAGVYSLFVTFSRGFAVTASAMPSRAALMSPITPQASS